MSCRRCCCRYTCSYGLPCRGSFMPSLGRQCHLTSPHTSSHPRTQARIKWERVQCVTLQKDERLGPNSLARTFLSSDCLHRSIDRPWDHPHCKGKTRTAQWSCRHGIDELSHRSFVSRPLRRLPPRNLSFLFIFLYFFFRTTFPLYSNC